MALMDHAKALEIAQIHKWREEFEKIWEMCDLRRFGESYISDKTTMMWEVFIDVKEIEGRKLENAAQIIVTKDDELLKLREQLESVECRSAGYQSSNRTLREQSKDLNQIITDLEESQKEFGQMETEIEKLKEQLKFHIENQEVSSLSRINQENIKLKEQLKKDTLEWQEKVFSLNDDLDLLKQELKQEREAVNFYGDVMSWLGVKPDGSYVNSEGQIISIDMFYGIVLHKDHDVPDGEYNYHGGKLARETIAKRKVLDE